jgi:hypothetical protein
MIRTGSRSSTNSFTALGKQTAIFFHFLSEMEVTKDNIGKRICQLASHKHGFLSDLRSLNP